MDDIIISYSKTCIFVSLHGKEKPAFSKTSTQGTCIENLSFGARKHHLHVDKRLKLVKKSLFSQKPDKWDWALASDTKKKNTTKSKPQ